MPIKLANNATSTTATAINASDIGVVLVTGGGTVFPALAAGEYFYITFESSGGTYEIAKATARVGDSLTIVRAQEGTTAQSFAAGSRVELRVTVQSIKDIIDADVKEQEYQTATQGQTVFSIGGFTYIVGINKLQVYVNGGKQVIALNYTETNATSITFLTGLNVGDIVEFTQ